MYKIIGADQKEYGPVTADQIRQWIAERRLNGQSLISAEGSPEWKPLAQFPEFAAALASGPASAVGPAPLPTYGPVPSMTGSAVPRTNPMAITGLVLGIIALPLTCCGCCGMPVGIAGIVFSALGLSHINRNPSVEEGRNLAIAGLILSILAVVLSLGLSIAFLPGQIQEIQRQLKMNNF